MFLQIGPMSFPMVLRDLASSLLNLSPCLNTMTNTFISSRSERSQTRFSRSSKLELKPGVSTTVVVGACTSPSQGALEYELPRVPAWEHDQT